MAMDCADLRPLDTMTVLTCRHGLIATKLYERRADGSWKDPDDYDNMLNFDARLEPVSSFDDMTRVLLGLDRAVRSFIVREVPREGQDWRDLKRRKKSMTLPSGGHYWCGIDIDKLPIAALGLSPGDFDPRRREDLERVVRLVEQHALPAELHGATVYYQWSSSAGMREWSKISLHLWYWLDRKVCPASLKRWATAARALGMNCLDPSFFDSVRIHYTAAPVVLDHNRRPLPDPMAVDAKGSLRRGVIRGADAVAPAIWLDEDGHRALEAREEQARVAELARRRQHQRRAMRSPAGRGTEQERARARLDRMADRFGEIPPASNGKKEGCGGAHPWLLGRIRAAFGMRDYLGLEEIADIIRARAVSALLGSGRPAHLVNDEVERMIKGAHDPGVAPATLLPLPNVRRSLSRERPGERPAKASSSASENDDQEGSPAAITMPLEVCSPVIAPAPITEEIPPFDPDFDEGWTIPEGGWVDEGEPLDVEEVRPIILDKVARLIGTGGSLVLGEGAGAGKTTAVLTAGIPASARRKADALFAEGFLDSPEDGPVDHRIRYSAPSLRLAREVVRDARREIKAQGAALNVTLAPARRAADPVDGVEATCFIPEETAAASRVHPSGADDVCKGCERHPENGGPGCPFLDDVPLSKVADILVTTHALRIGGQGREEDEDERWMLDVIDEDCSGSLFYNGELTAEQLVTLRKAGDIEVHDEERWAALLTTILESEGVGGRDAILGHQVAALIGDSITVHDVFNEGASVVAEAIKVKGEERVKRLAQAIGWRNVAALRQQRRLGWGGAIIAGGRLKVTLAQTLDTDSAHATIHLDATTALARSRALLGPDTEVSRTPIKWNPHARVVWIPLACGHRSRLTGADGRPGGRRVALAWSAAIDRMTSTTNALIITSKGNRGLGGDDGTWTSGVLLAAEAAGAAITHHCGPEGRGVNRYRDRTGVMIDPWYVPMDAVEQRAWSWCALAGEDWNDDAVREYWTREADAQMHGGEVLQEAGRGRAYDATAERPVTITIVDTRDPRSLGIPVHEIIDPDRLIWEAWGESGYNVAPSVVADVVRRAGGLYAPTIDSESPAPMGIVDLQTGILADRQSNISDAVREYLPIGGDVDHERVSEAGKVLSTWAGHHSWEQLAEWGGVGLLMVHHNRGGDAIPFLFDREVTAAALESWLRARGISRYRLSDAEPWREVTGMASELRAALASSDLDRVPDEARIDHLATRMGCVRKTVERHIDRLRAPGEERAEALERLRAEVYAERASAWINAQPDADHARRYLCAIGYLCAIWRRRVIEPAQPEAPRDGPPMPSQLNP